MSAASKSTAAKRPVRYATVDAYVESFPPAVRVALEQVRRGLHEAITGAGETISYDIPTLTIDGVAVVYFAGWKKHVSLYPVPDGDAEFDELVAPYRSGASTAKFPLAEPIPVDVVRRAGVLLARRHGAGRS
jgi:uncharacterized protein YdhG (YjbR/CyaY superfamily)